MPPSTGERLPLGNRLQSLEGVTVSPNVWTSTQGCRNHEKSGKEVSTKGIQDIYHDWPQKNGDLGIAQQRIQRNRSRDAQRTTREPR